MVIEYLQHSRPEAEFAEEAAKAGERLTAIVADVAARGRRVKMPIPTPRHFGLNGQRAVVAGGSCGPDIAFAAALAGQCAKVTLAAHHGGQLADVTKALKARGRTAKAMRPEVTDIAVINTSNAGAGPFDVPMSAAALARHAPANRTTKGDHDTVTAGGAGNLINLSLLMGDGVGQDRSVQRADHRAVKGCIKAVGRELGLRGCGVSTIAPTPAATDLQQSTLDAPEKRNSITINTHPGRTAKVKDGAAAAQSLALGVAAVIAGTLLNTGAGLAIA